MTRPWLASLLSFGAGVVCTVAAFGLFVDVSAQPANEVVDTCASADGTLRLIQPFGVCAPGERRVRLREPDLDKQEQKPEEQKKLLDLDQRVKQLEERARGGRLLGSRVYAPFEVINEAGSRVFTVEDGLVRFHNAVGAPVARVVMTTAGGYFEARSATSPKAAALGAVAESANLFVLENDIRRINLGRNEEGHYALRVFEPGGKIVAGIGQSTLGDGVVTISDAQGHPRARLYAAAPGRGILDLLNASGKAVALLAATESGNGRMELYNRDGTKMVEAGINVNNVGSVRAGPDGFHPGVTFLGLPGSFIAGKAAQ